MKILPLTNSINCKLAEKSVSSQNRIKSDITFEGRQSLNVIPSVQRRNNINFSKIIPQALKIIGLIAIGDLIITKLLTSEKSDKSNRAETKNNLSDEDKYIKDNPKREAYTKYLEKFPVLHKTYKDTVREHLKDPEKRKTADRLSVMETTFESLYQEDEKLRKLNTKYFDVLETKYSDNLGSVFDAMALNLKNYGSVYSFMNCLLSDKISQKDIKEYNKQKLLSFEDFLEVHDVVDKYSMQSVNILRERDNIERFNLEKGNFKIEKMDGSIVNNHIFRVQFKEDAPLQEKLKDVVSLNEMLYGPLNTTVSTEFPNIRKFKEELIRHALTDNDLSFSFNILKFIYPEKTMEYKNSRNLTKKVKFLTYNDKEFEELRDFIQGRFKLLPLKNYNLRMLYKLVNSTDKFPEILQTSHAKLRFVGRIVLNKMCSPDELEQKALTAADTLSDELNFRLNTGCRIFPYLNSYKGYTPSMYLGKTPFCSFVKVSFNKEGQIQTIYQDVPGKVKVRNQVPNPESELLQQ